MSVMTNYDPLAISMVFRGITIGGFSDGSLVKIARAEESFKLKVGTTGEVARSRNRNRSGSVEFTLMHTSASNDLLTQAWALDELNGSGTGALLVRDILGTTKVNGDQCYVEKPPDVEFAKEVGDRVWRIIVPELDMFIGGALR